MEILFTKTKARKIERKVLRLRLKKKGSVKKLASSTFQMGKG